MILLGASIFRMPEWYDNTFNIGFSNNGFGEILAAVLILVGLILVVSIIRIALNNINES